MSSLHMLGSFHGVPRWPMRAALLGTAGLVTVLGRLQLAWRDLESATWWASNARDVVNLFAVAAFAVALVGLGLPLAAAVLLAAQGVLLTVGVEALLERAPRVPAPDAWALVAALCWTLPVALWPEQTLRGLEALCQALAG